MWGSILSVAGALGLNAGGPPGFDGNVFIDFTQAQYEIRINVRDKKAIAISKIEFESPQSGNPLFDLVPDPSQVFLDGSLTNAPVISTPDRITRLRRVSQSVTPGRHVLEITHDLSSSVTFENGTAASFFMLSDLDDREYLEQYLPTNLEYDAYPSTWTVTLTGAQTGPQKDHRVFSNGLVSRTDGACGKESCSRWVIDYPPHYTCSSPFFHILPESSVRILSFNYDSVGEFQKTGRFGRDKTLPVTIYGPESQDTLESFKRSTVEALQELERDYGPFPHGSLTIYAGPIDGGMEYAGATVTSQLALSHELTHSYFARGVLPVNGDAGWIDEAIASWRDEGYPRRSQVNFGTTTMGKKSPYNRKTDRRAYEEGQRFVAHLDWNLVEKGLGTTFRRFLALWSRELSTTSVSTEDFQKQVSGYGRQDFSALFNRHIYGLSSGFSPEKDREAAENAPFSPYHPQRSGEDAVRLNTATPTTQRLSGLPTQPTDPSHPGSGGSAYTYQAVERLTPAGRVSVYLPKRNAVDPKLPVVVFGHGQALGEDNYKATFEHLARRGIVVIYPVYDTGFFDQDWKRMSADYVSLTETALRTIPALDSANVTFAGHSKGAYIAVSAAGIGSRSTVLSLKAVVAMSPAGFVSELVDQIRTDVPVTLTVGQNDLKSPSDLRAIASDLFTKVKSTRKQLIDVKNYPTLSADHFFPLTQGSFITGTRSVGPYHWHSVWKWLYGAVTNSDWLYGPQALDSGDPAVVHSSRRSF